MKNWIRNGVWFEILYYPKSLHKAKVARILVRLRGETLLILLVEILLWHLLLVHVHILKHLVRLLRIHRESGLLLMVIIPHRLSILHLLLVHRSLSRHVGDVQRLGWCRGLVALSLSLSLSLHESELLIGVDWGLNRFTLVVPKVLKGVIFVCEEQIWRVKTLISSPFFLRLFLHVFGLFLFERIQVK